VVLGTVLFLTVEVVVVVVGATGFSTTVVHEVNKMATAKSGMRMICFFIIGIGFSSQETSAQMPQPDVFRAKFF
jgi:hypothetical protein